MMRVVFWSRIKLILIYYSQYIAWNEQLQNWAFKNFWLAVYVRLYCINCQVFRMCWWTHLSASFSYSCLFFLRLVSWQCFVPSVFITRRPQQVQTVPRTATAISMQCSLSVYREGISVFCNITSQIKVVTRNVNITLFFVCFFKESVLMCEECSSRRKYSKFKLIYVLF